MGIIMSIYFCRGQRDLYVTVSVGPSISPSVRRSVRHTLYFCYLKVEKLGYEYFMDITAPAQPFATGAAVYTALFLCDYASLFKGFCPSVRLSVIPSVHLSRGNFE